MADKFIIPNSAIIDAVSSTKRIALSAIYGVGIQYAITREKNQKSFNSNYEINSEYSPDAQYSEGGGTASDRWDGRMSQSLQGMPVMCALTFLGGDYQDTLGNVITIPEISFETVVVSATMNKDIIKSPVTGSQSGNIQENNGLLDWDVEIRALITADAPLNTTIERMPQEGVYPRENMEELSRVLIAPIAIPVDCWYLNMLDIDYLLIESGTRIEQIPGEYSTQRIIIPCTSSKPLIIKIAQ